MSLLIGIDFGLNQDHYGCYLFIPSSNMSSSKKKFKKPLSVHVTTIAKHDHDDDDDKDEPSFKRDGGNGPEAQLQQVLETCDVLPILSRKHVPLKRADTDLVFLGHRISKIRNIYQTCKFEIMGYTPVDSQGNLYPTLDSIRDRELIQPRFDDMIRRVASVTCYIGLHREDALRDIPEPGFHGRSWLNGFLKSFRSIQRDYERLRVDIIYHALVLVYIMAADTSKNVAFDGMYSKTFASAIRIIRDSIPSTDDTFAHDPEFIDLYMRSHNGIIPSAADDIEEVRYHYSKFICNMSTLEYSLRPYMQRFFPGAETLSIVSLVGFVAELFRINLLRWDRVHGVTIPRVRRVLEVFSYDMEPEFHRGNYNLTALFNK